MEQLVSDVFFNAAMLVADVVALTLVWRWKNHLGVLSGAVVAVVACALLAVMFTPFSGGGIFVVLRYCSYGTFLHGFLLLAGGCWILWRENLRWAAALGTCALAVAGIGVDAFAVEPTALELTHHRIESERVTEPLRIGVLADLQTDEVGDYERRVLELLLESEPDLILLPGDYIHSSSHEQWARETSALRQLLVEVGFGAPLGVVAVDGNTEVPGWPEIFRGLDVTAVGDSRRVEISDEVVVTALDLTDSFDPHIQVPRSDDRLHIVMGHAPDFALGAVDGDVLVAGHCHGGQVRLPWIGPPITLSRVPGEWTSGLTELSDGRSLVVSRGVGMERAGAPELRFLCRPELVLIDVVPVVVPR